MKKIYILVFILSLFSLNCYGFTFRSSIGQSVIGETSLGEDTVKAGIMYLENTGSKSKSGVTENIPLQYSLEQNYPNPFNPTTTISFSLPENQFVSLKVYNVLGAEVVELAGKDFTKGIHTVNFNANKCVSGLYFYRMQTKGYSNIKKMMIVK